MVLAWGWACTRLFFCSTLLLPKVTSAIPVAFHLARPKVLCFVTSFVASEINGLHRAHLKLLLAGAVFEQDFREAKRSEPGTNLVSKIPISFTCLTCKGKDGGIRIGSLPSPVRVNDREIRSLSSVVFPLF